MLICNKDIEVLPPPLHKLGEVIVTLAAIQGTVPFCYAECPDDVYLRLVWAYAGSDERYALRKWFKSRGMSSAAYAQSVRGNYYILKQSREADDWRGTTNYVGNVLNELKEKADWQMASVVLAQANGHYQVQPEHYVDNMRDLYAKLHADCQEDQPIAIMSDRAAFFLEQGMRQWIEHKQRYRHLSMKDIQTHRLSEGQLAHHVFKRAGALEAAGHFNGTHELFCMQLAECIDYMVEYPTHDAHQVVRAVTKGAQADIYNVWGCWIENHNSGCDSDDSPRRPYRGYAPWDPNDEPQP
jgi:hypothetical protein